MRRAAGRLPPSSVWGLSAELGPWRWRSLAAASAAGTASAIAGIGLLATSGWLITRASQRPPIFELSVAIGMVQAFALGRGLSRYLQRLTVHQAVLGRLTQLRLWLFDRVEELVPDGLPGRASGAMLSGFLSDAEAVAEAMAKGFTALVDSGATLGAGVILVALLDPGAAAVLLTVGVLMLLAAVLTSRLGRAGAQAATVLRSELAEAVVEALVTAPELVVYGRQDLVDLRLGQIHQAARGLATRRGLVAGFSRLLTTWLAGAGLVGTLLAGVAARSSGRLPPVLLAVVALVALVALDQVAALPVALAAATSGNAAARRLGELAALPEPAREPAVDHQPSGPANWVALDDVTALSPRDPGAGPILDGVTLSTSPGQRLALTGPSGAGKTTVLSLLLHFLEPSRGRVTLGGVETREMTRAGLAGRLGWVPPDTHIFSASLRSNLQLARPDAGDQDLVEALRRVGLGPWLQLLPRGLDTRLGAGGSAVSAGERQRLGLARALLSRAELLLLDEPDAHLDPSTSMATVEELMAAAGARPVVLVTHDRAIVELVDQVVSLRSGRVLGRRTGEGHPRGGGMTVPEGRRRQGSCDPGVPPGGFEPPTVALEGRRSDPLS